MSSYPAHILHTTLCDKVCQWLVVGQWFSPGTPLIKVTAKNGINEILLKVALNTITLTPDLCQAVADNLEFQEAQKKTIHSVKDHW